MGVKVADGMRTVSFTLISQRVARVLEFNSHAFANHHGRRQRRGSLSSSAFRICSSDMSIRRDLRSNPEGPTRRRGDMPQPFPKASSGIWHSVPYPVDEQFNSLRVSVQEKRKDVGAFMGEIVTVVRGCIWHTGGKRVDRPSDLPRYGGSSVDSLE